MLVTGSNRWGHAPCLVRALRKGMMHEGRIWGNEHYQRCVRGTRGTPSVRGSPTPIAQPMHRSAQTLMPDSTLIASVPALLYRPPVDRRGCAAPRGRAAGGLLYPTGHYSERSTGSRRCPRSSPRPPRRLDVRLAGTHAEESSVSMAAASLVFYQGRSPAGAMSPSSLSCSHRGARPVAGPHGATHDDSSAPARRALAGGVRAGGKTEMPSANCCRTCGRRRIAPRRPDPIGSPPMRCREKDAQSHA